MLLQGVCSLLRTRHGVIAVPASSAQRELIACNAGSAPLQLEGDTWHATVHPGSNRRLSVVAEPDQSVLAELVQKTLVHSFHRSDRYVRTSQSVRYWHDPKPEQVAGGIEMLPRLSFSTIALPDLGIGVIFDFHHLFQTEMTVADYFDEHIPASARDQRRREFNRLRQHRNDRRGTLLYQVRRTVAQVCYFHEFASGTTCATTGAIKLPHETYGSLFEYYQATRPSLEIAPDDPVAYVSFPGMIGAKPVAAKLLRLRVSLDPRFMPKQLRSRTTMPPSERRDKLLQLWRTLNPNPLKTLGLQMNEDLWRPTVDQHELLPCPTLSFGLARAVRPPAEPSVRAYRTYFARRRDALAKGGVFRFEESVGRQLHVVVPRSIGDWSDAVTEALVAGVVDLLQDFCGRTFNVRVVQADSSEEMVAKLSGSTGVAVIVFDDRDRAAYSILSHELAGWRIKRMTKFKLLKAWHARNAHGQNSNGFARQWDDILLHSVYDLLNQMECTPWRIADWPYESCLAIDVSEARRYFALSLLICRDQGLRPGIFRTTVAWPKGDHQHETINPRQLADKIEALMNDYRGSSFDPLRSMLVLRDGHECGFELQGIREGLLRWKKRDYLAQAAVVDVLDVHKKTVKHARMWKHRFSKPADTENALEGQAIYLTPNTALVTCTGAATLSRRATADPCMLVAHDGSDLRRGTKGFFALSHLNFTSPGKAYRYAQPLRDSDEILRDRVARDMRGIR
ncbi:MAG: hypothetical protein KF841_03140 [Phycisphaerae bacterium]|nr:hypothetical protein [Phycisphaerae bacterium]